MTESVPTASAPPERGIKFQRVLKLSPAYVSDKLSRFLAEDGADRDLTTLATIARETISRASIVAREPMVFAGEQIIPHCFDGSRHIEMKVADGVEVGFGETIAVVSGPAREILSRERVVLNLLQRLCGIATCTRRYVDVPAPDGFMILDTRKMTPGLRRFEKYAVAVGGGHNHRRDLASAILIKDNHIRAAGGLHAAVEGAQTAHPDLPIELEVDTTDQLEEGLDLNLDGFLLDNMPPEMIKRAVVTARSHPNGENVLLEASGGITLETLPDYVWTGVDGVSVGALTNRCRNVDIAMDFA